MALTKISTDGVKDDAVTAGKIPANAVGSSELADNAVDTNAIQDQAVALSKLPHGDSNNNGKFLRANNGADPSFETVSIPAGTTINNNADNRVITGSGTANTLNGESTLTWNGTLLDINQSGTVDTGLKLRNSEGGLYVRTNDDKTFIDTDQLIIRNEAETERMRIDSSGKVGIGTTSPSRTLHVSGDVLGNAFMLAANTTPSSSIQAQIYRPADNELAFATNGANERMRLTSGGALLLGTTTDLGHLTVSQAQNTTNSNGAFTSPHIRLDAPQTTNTHGFTGIAYSISSLTNYGYTCGAKRTGTGGGTGAFIWQHHNNSATGNFNMGLFGDDANLILGRSTNQFVGFGTADGIRYAGLKGQYGAAQDVGLNFFTTTNAGTSIVNHFRIEHNGELYGTDQGIGSISDSRVKKNVADYSYDIEKFKQYKSKTFDWINPEMHGDKTNVKGFLAQDLEAVDNQWVTTINIDKDDPDYDLVDKGTNGQGEDVGIIKTSKFGSKDAMYISVINQLIARVETLETKVAALEAD